MQDVGILYVTLKSCQGFPIYIYIYIYILYVVKRNLLFLYEIGKIMDFFLLHIYIYIYI